MSLSMKDRGQKSNVPGMSRLSRSSQTRADAGNCRDKPHVPEPGHFSMSRVHHNHTHGIAPPTTFSAINLALARLKAFFVASSDRSSA